MGTLVGRIRDFIKKGLSCNIIYNIARYEHEQPEILAGFGPDFKFIRAARSHIMDGYPQR